LSKNEAKRPENFKLTPFKQEIFIGALIIIWHNHFTIYIFRKAIYEKRHIDGGTREMSPCIAYQFFWGFLTLPLVGFEMTFVVNGEEVIFFKESVSSC